MSLSISVALQGGAGAWHNRQWFSVFVGSFVILMSAGHEVARLRANPCAHAGV